MASSILDRYGIKEVADVTFYKISDGKGDVAAGLPMEPVLYLDTLKVSTIEQTAENTSARGGKGNPELIIWDYGKEITVTLEDALFSAKSMAVMFGSGGDNATVGTEATIRKTLRVDQLDVSSSDSSMTIKAEINGQIVNISSGTFYSETGSGLGSVTTLSSVPEGAAFLTWDFEGKDPAVIEISAETFPGTYYITGDTYARSETTGEDEFFQFVIPKAKVLSEVTLTLEAEGDPSTFSMNVKVLRPKDGKMMKLIKYDLPSAG